MPTLEQLEIFAGQLARLEKTVFPGSTATMMNQGDGYRWLSFEVNAGVAAVLEATTCELPDWLREGDIELDYVQAYSRIKPHKHLGSDVVLVCRQVPAGTEYFSQPDPETPGIWKPLAEGQVLLLPRGAPHGFRLDPQIRSNLELIGVNYPPIAEDDVIEVYDAT